MIQHIADIHAFMPIIGVMMGVIVGVLFSIAREIIRIRRILERDHIRDLALRENKS